MPCGYLGQELSRPEKKVQRLGAEKRVVCSSSRKETVLAKGRAEEEEVRGIQEHYLVGCSRSLDFFFPVGFEQRNEMI